MVHLPRRPSRPLAPDVVPSATGPKPGVVEGDSLPNDLPFGLQHEARPEFVALRHHLWHRIRAMVAADPQSEFFDRAVSGERKVSTSSGVAAMADSR